MRPSHCKTTAFQCLDPSLCDAATLKTGEQYCLCRGNRIIGTVLFLPFLNKTNSHLLISIREEYFTHIQLDNWSILIFGSINRRLILSIQCTPDKLHVITLNETFCVKLKFTDLLCKIV